MTRKLWGYKEECTNDDLNAILDDISLNQMIAAFPYTEMTTAFVSRVVGDADEEASDDTTALLYSIIVNPLRGDHLWFRYTYKNAATQNVGDIQILYRVWNLARTELKIEITKTKSQSTSEVEVVDVLDLSSVAGLGDLSGIPVAIDVLAYWPGEKTWFDAVDMSADISGTGGLISALWRAQDGAIYFVGTSGSYVFWDQAHTPTSLSAQRDENPPTYSRSSYIATHPNYGMIYVGDSGPSSGVKSRRIANDVDHYTTGSPDSDGEDYQTITGFASNSDTDFDFAIVRKGSYFYAIRSRTPSGSPPYSTRGGLQQNYFGDLDDPSPAWSGSATEILEDGSGNPYIPESDGSHPDGSGLDPEIWDAYILCDEPTQAGGGFHYFARYEWQGVANASGSVVYQYNDNTFELLDELDDFYDNAPTTYPEYGPIAPGVKRGDPTRVAIAVWQHVNNGGGGAGDNDLFLKVLRRSGAQGSPGTWTWETVHSITGITDADLTGLYRWNSGLGGSKGSGSDQGSCKVDYGWDYDGNEHIIWSQYVAGDSPYTHVYYSFKDNSDVSPAWTTPVKVSVGSAWSSFISSGQVTKIFSLAILKDNGYIPWRSTDLRMVWTGRDYVNTTKAFMGGIRLDTGEDDISVYAPEVFMNDRDDTSGPDDMLW